jgi:serine protease DegQ
MKFLKNFAFFVKYAVIGSIVGFAILFFVPNSPFSFNWHEAKQAWQYYQKASSSIPTNTSHSVSEAVEKAGASVVSVRAMRKSRVRPAPDGRAGDVLVDTPFGVGSGVVFDKRGYIVTNYHVVENSAEIAAYFSNGLRKKAEIVGFDQRNDIAVLKVDIETPDVAELGNSSEVRTGDEVMAIGTPFGLFQNSVTKGIISSIDHGPLYPKIQTDAAINYGNSGGALINTKGQVIGISSAKFSFEANDEIGINFGIPIDVVKESFEQIVKNGRVIRNWFGAELLQLNRAGYLQVDPGVEYGTGLLINRIEVGSPSSEAGLIPGDYLIEFDGHLIRDMVQLRKIFLGLPIGKDVIVKVLRNKQPIEIKLQLREKPQN